MWSGVRTGMLTQEGNRGDSGDDKITGNNNTFCEGAENPNAWTVYYDEVTGSAKLNKMWGGQLIGNQLGRHLKNVQISDETQSNNTQRFGKGR